MSTQSGGNKPRIADASKERERIEIGERGKKRKKRKEKRRKLNGPPMEYPNISTLVQPRCLRREMASEAMRGMVMRSRELVEMMEDPMSL